MVQLQFVQYLNQRSTDTDLSRPMATLKPVPLILTPVQQLVNNKQLIDADALTNNNIDTITNTVTISDTHIDANTGNNTITILVSIVVQYRFNTDNNINMVS